MKQQKFFYPVASVAWESPDARGIYGYPLFIAIPMMSLRWLLKPSVPKI